MQITRKKRDFEKRSIRSREEPFHDMQLYFKPPSKIINLAEMYDYVLNRLKVLKILDQTLPRTRAMTIEEKKMEITREFRKHGLRTYVKLLRSSGHGVAQASDAERWEDYISHFVLRLAYCQSDSLRQWFLAKEMELFRLRFHSLSTQGIREFLEAYELHYSPIPLEEKSLIVYQLATSTYGVIRKAVMMLDFFKVHFSNVIDLISTRRVYLNKGMAYVPSKNLLSIIINIYRKNLGTNLELATCVLPTLAEDERLRHLLTLHEYDFGGNFEPLPNTGTISAADLDPLSRVSFPPCMIQLHESIRRDHHAKYGTRMQYGLFLKAIGLSLEESITFWKSEFTKKITQDKFQTHYLYSIRHNYGQEGKRVSRSPYSCAKILSSAVGPGDCHGCPFKHNGGTILRQQLSARGIPALGIQAMMDFVKQKQYELACTKYFELTHPTAVVEVIHHPNQYFELSRAFYSDKEAQSKRKNENKSESQMKVRKRS